MFPSGSFAVLGTDAFLSEKSTKRRTSVIQVEGLSKAYGNRKAVDGIGFSIGKGEIVGFLGPNGAGKSTTMNMMTGYISATAGTIRIDGIDVAERPEDAKRKIGYLPEQPPLYNEMTANEYLRFAAELKGVPRSRRSQAIAHAAELTGVAEVGGRLLKNLSKGYRQRVGLAQALIADPEVLILDEPTVGLDPKQIADIRTLIRTLGEARTVVLSTHILPEVSAVCSRVLIIDHGVIVADGKAEELAAGLSGAGRLSLKVAGDSDALSRVLGNLKDAGIASYELIGGADRVGGADRIGGAETAEAVLGLEQGADPRERLFYALAEARLPILHLKSADATLEDLFLRLTTREEKEVTE